MPSIALTPLFCASITASLVVALVISSFALSAAVLASCVNAVFSSVVKSLAELIASNFFDQDSNLTDEQKQAAKDQIDSDAKTAQDAINNAKTNDDVKKAVDHWFELQLLLHL